MSGTLGVNNITDAAGSGSPAFPNHHRDAFYLSPQVITADYTVPTGFNAMTAGPVEIALGVTVEVADGSEWTVV